MPETEKLTRKEKRLRWKEAKRARRQAEKDYYRYAPWLKRVWNLYLKKPCGTIIVLAVIIGLLSSLFPAFLQETVVPLLYAFNSANKDSPLDEAGMEKLYEKTNRKLDRLSRAIEKIPECDYSRNHQCPEIPNPQLLILIKINLNIIK